MLIEIRERRRVPTWYYSFNHSNMRYRSWLHPVNVMSKREATAEVQRIFADVVKGDIVPHRKAELDFHNVVDGYLDYLKEHRPKTYASAKSIILIAKQFFGKRPTKADIVEYQKLRRAKGVTGSSINRELSYCRAAVNRAIRQEAARANPFDHFEKFRETARTRYLSRSEIKRLFDVLNNYVDHAGVLRDIVIVAIFSGMRRKEILNLHADEIDFDLNTITKAGDKTKNGEVKVVPMAEEIVEIISRRLQTSTSGYVFENKKTGRAITDIKKSFKTVLNNAGISNFKFHDLRHTFATYALLSSNNIRIVQDLLGHRSLKMTQRYTHVLIEQKSQVLTAASKMIGDAICNR